MELVDQLGVAAARRPLPVNGESHCREVGTKGGVCASELALIVYSSLWVELSSRRRLYALFVDALAGMRWSG